MDKLNYGNFKKISETELEGNKTLEICDIKSESSEEGYIISGYANTKNKADAYGDIPTNYNGNPVYDFKRFKLNPVLFVDHNNSASFIAGKFITYKEDDKGLLFKAILRPVDSIHNPLVKDAVQAFMDGYGKALSIGGRWHFEDNKNPTHLTKASIHEVSIVGIGADQYALTEKNIEDTQGKKSRNELEVLIDAYRETGSEEVIKKIKKIKESIKWN